MKKEQAIKELTQLLHEDFLSEYSKAIRTAIKALEQEPCDDAISRQAVIDTLTKTSGIRGDALKALYDLPSVTPQQNPNIKALGEDIRICQKSITDKKVLIGFNMAVALCNKHLAES